MKANELRIGNWYWWNSEGKNYEYQVEPRDFGNDNFKNFEPIPLTEEWLIRFGSKKNDEELTIPINRHMYISFFDNSCQLITDDDFLIMDIESVHQLQNLYFALTGEELTIKP